jgi:hypothetical protein
MASPALRTCATENLRLTAAAPAPAASRKKPARDKLPGNGDWGVELFAAPFSRFGIILEISQRNSIESNESLSPIL